MKFSYKKKERKNEQRNAERLCNVRRAKGIKSEIVIEAIEQAITAAYKRQYGQAQNVKVIFDEKERKLQCLFDS